MQTPRTAFTLVEVALVIIIMAVIAAMALPNFSATFSGSQLKQIEQDLLHKARWSQIMAVGTRRIYALSFAQQPDSYKVVTVDRTDSDHPVLVSVPTAMGRAHIIPNGVEVRAPDGPIEFHPDGTITPAVIELRSKHKKSILSSTARAGVLQVVNDQ